MALTLSCAVLLPIFSAEAKSRLKFSKFLTFQYITKDNNDLGSDNISRQSSYSIQPRIQVKAYPSKNIRGFLDIRGVKTSGNDGYEESEDETGIAAFNQSFLELRNLNVSFNTLLGHEGLSLKLGRQRLKEERALWWNRDFDAAVLSYKNGNIKGLVGIGQNLAAYRTNHTDFMEDDEDRARLFGEASYEWQKGHIIEIRALYEYDYSGTESIGDLIRADDRDELDQKLLWAGLRTKATLSQTLSYRVDGIVVAGEEKELTTISTANNEFRQVSSVQSRDVLGWAIDAELIAALDMPLSPIFTFGYAFGSGDSDTTDGTNTEFRQSGLHSNANRPEGSIGFVRNYGDILKPELSNMHIITAATNVSLGKNSDLHALYHYYHLDENTLSLRADGISVDPNGSDKSLGHSIDLSLNIDL